MDICGQDGGGGSAVVVNLDRVKMYFKKITNLGNNQSNKKIGK